jgi:hypothetical protein
VDVESLPRRLALRQQAAATLRGGIAVSAEYVQTREGQLELRCDPRWQTGARCLRGGGREQGTGTSRVTARLLDRAPRDRSVCLGDSVFGHTDADRARQLDGTVPGAGAPQHVRKAGGAESAHPLFAGAGAVLDCVLKRRSRAAVVA